MLHFNELRYSDDLKKIIISASIDADEAFENCFLEQLIIDNQDTYIDNGPSNNPIYSYTFADDYIKGEVPVQTEENQDINVTTEEHPDDNVYVEDYIYDDSKGLQNIRIVINLKNQCAINPDKDILFVYIIARGTPKDTALCGTDVPIIMGTLINLYRLYAYSLGYIRQVEERCDIPSYFIDYMLRLKALQLFIKTGNYIALIKYWKKYFTDIKYKGITSSCGCNGNR